MSDVNTFIDAVGKDVSATVVPRIAGLAEGIGSKVKGLVDEQAAVIRDFAASLTKELFQRYHPQLTGELHATVVSGGLQITGHDVRLDLKRRDTGATVSSLDIPVSLTIKVDDLAVSIEDATIALNVVR